MLEIVSDFSEDIKIITPIDNYHYFFAYYDMRATGEGGINQRHLCHRVKFMDRLPTKDDVCELGCLEDGRFIKFAETTAWNFQQGAMLQYHPNKADTVYYNVDDGGQFKTVIHDVKNGNKLYTDRATACVSPDGKYGIAINFGRVFAFRPGYGYAGFVDTGAHINAPDDDGAFLTDMNTGKSNLLISYKELRNESGFFEDEKILINHVTFNTSSDKFVMLVRNFYKEGGMWTTSMVVGSLDGKFKVVLKNTFVSHYYWLNSNEILAFCSADGEKSMLYVINVESGEYKSIDSPYFHGSYNPDIHCTVTPNGKFIIGDGYPIDGYRHILAINVETGESKTILKAKTDIPKIVDVRCDLHARYVLGGKYVSFDTTHRGRREIAVFPTNKIYF